MDEDIPKAIASKSLYRDREVALNREHETLRHRMSSQEYLILFI